MQKVKRNKDKVWIEIDKFYPPKHKYPNTLFKSIAIALQAIGSDITYDLLMGISGSAFRLQLHERWDASSPHPDCGFNCTEIALKALKLRQVSKTYDYKKEQSDTILKAIIESIEKGHPVLASSYETGLIVGYVNNAKSIKLLVREPYSNKGDESEAIKIVPGRFTIIEGNPPKLDIRSYIDSLNLAVKLANIRQIKSFACGFSAYEKWISELLDEKKIKHLKKDNEPDFSNDNAHIYYCLIDARQSAARYLSYIKTILSEKVHPNLNQASVYYSDIADQLQNGIHNILWEWEFYKCKKWTEKMRKEQAFVLKKAMTIEQKAIVEIEKIVKML